jgi:glycosyltransferase involved in cell wall biosynthesis
LAGDMWRAKSLSEMDFFVDDITSDDVTILIPTLNEEEAIGSVIDEVVVQGFQKIIIVDGKSVDRTVEIAQSHGVDVITQNGVGKTGAIKTAISHVTTPFLIVIDGDSTYAAADIDNILQYLKYFDEVIGARSNGRDNIRSLNRFGNWVINQTFNILFGTDLTDVCSGLYGLRKSFVEKIHLNTRGFDVEVEIAAQAANAGKLTEVPINYRERIGIQKLRPFRDGFYIMKTLLGLGFRYSPVILLSSLLALAMLPSVFLLSYTAVEWFRGVWHDGLAMLGTFMFLIGFQSLVLSIFSMQQRRSVHEVARNITQLRFLKKE